MNEDISVCLYFSVPDKMKIISKTYFFFKAAVKFFVGSTDLSNQLVLGVPSVRAL